MPPDPPRGYRLRRAFIRTPLRQILDPPQRHIKVNTLIALTSFLSERLDSDTPTTCMQQLKLSEIETVSYGTLSPIILPIPFTNYYPVRNRDFAKQRT